MTPLTIVLDARATTAHFPGVARATVGLINGLSEIDHQHTIGVLAYGDAPPPSLPAFRDRRLMRIPTRAAPLGSAQQWQMPLLSRSLRPDVWHAPYYIRPLIGVPRPVVTVFDVIGRVVPGALPSLRARLLFDRLLRLSLRGATRIITSSAATRRDLQHWYGVDPQRVAVIPLASDPHFEPQSEQAIQHVRDQYDLPPRYLLYLGSNKPHKNLVTLINAFAKLDTDATLVIAGRWDRRYDAPERVATPLGKRVRFLHNVADCDLPALLSDAYAFVFPSLYEGFGLPPLEAMACGTPVIASNTSALPEVIGAAGLLVAPQVDALADAMQTLLDDPRLRERLRERGLIRAQQFSWARTARETVQVYEHVAL